MNLQQQENRVQSHFILVVHIATRPVFFFGEIASMFAGLFILHKISRQTTTSAVRGMLRQVLRLSISNNLDRVHLSLNRFVVVKVFEINDNAPKWIALEV